MRRRDYDRLMKKHAAEPLHGGVFDCTCDLARTLKIEMIRRADLMFPEGIKSPTETSI